jgi:UDP:flavonoid glycosyltransferase YjiC (YdhE family)
MDLLLLAVKLGAIIYFSHEVSALMNATSGYFLEPAILNPQWGHQILASIGFVCYYITEFFTVIHKDFSIVNMIHFLATICFYLLVVIVLFIIPAYNDRELNYPRHAILQLRPSRYKWYQHNVYRRLYKPRLVLSVVVFLNLLNEALIFRTLRIHNSSNSSSLDIEIGFREVQFAFCVFLHLVLLWYSVRSVLKVRASFFHGFISKYQQEWEWPIGQIGVLPFQTLPVRISKETLSNESMFFSPLPKRKSKGMNLSPTSSKVINSIMSPTSTSSSFQTLQVSAPIESRFGESPASLPSGPLRVILVGWGSVMDMYPLIGLALSLRENGHSVHIVCNGYHSSFLRAKDLSGSFIHSPLMDDVLHQSRTGKSHHVVHIESISDSFHEIVEETLNACVSPTLANVVISTKIISGIASSIAEARGIPCWILRASPNHATAALAAPGYSSSKIGFINQFSFARYRSHLRTLCAKVGLSRQLVLFRKACSLESSVPLIDLLDPLDQFPTLCGYSSHLLPIPMDSPSSYFQCGFPAPISEPDFHLSPDADLGLLRFLDRPSRAALAVVSFDVSYSSTIPASFYTMIVQTLTRFNFDVVIISEYAHRYIEIELSTVFIAKTNTPLDWLLGKAALLVHDGNSFSIGSALCAGIPSLVLQIDACSDQMGWGNAIEKVEAGVFVKTVTPYTLDQAMRKLLEGEPSSFSGTHCGDKANSIGASIRAEKSGETASSLLESCICNLILSPAEADEIHPLCTSPLPTSLSQTQLVCLKHCVPCNNLRRLKDPYLAMK